MGNIYGNSSFKNGLFFLFSTVVLSACVTSASLDKGPGALLSKGLVAGELGRGLDPQSKRKAIDAEITALSNSATGVETKWQGQKNTSGIVIPGQLFEVSGKICRRYSHEILVNGQSQSDEATACKNEDGVWEPLQ
jgi:surface antigen